MVVQSCHSIAEFSSEYPKEFKTWKEASNSIICLSTPDEKSLLQLFTKLNKLTPTVRFFEPDVDEYTSIALLGTPEVRKKLSHLPLILKSFIGVPNHQKNDRFGTPINECHKSEQLMEEINELGYVGTGKKYKVSDNSIRKWIKNYKRV